MQPHIKKRRLILKYLTGSVDSLWGCIFCLFIFMILVLLVSIAALFSSNHINNNDDDDDNNDIKVQKQQHKLHRFEMTENMKYVKKGLYYLGEAYDPQSYRLVKGYTMFLYHHYEISPDNNVIQKKSHGTGPCSDPFAVGSRWKIREDFVIDSTNNQGLSEKYFFDMNWLAMCEWDSKLNFRIFGNRDTNSIVDGPDEISPDGKNEIQFSFINEANVIAFTSVWGIFDGPIDNREIIEADIVYNLNFQWGNVSTTPGNIMDGENIAVHEFGHYIGLGHISNTESTMFANANFRETKKRSLLSCEIEGLCIHYDESDTCLGHNSTGTTPPRFTSLSSLSFKILNIEKKFLIFLNLIFILLLTINFNQSIN